MPKIDLTGIPQKIVNVPAGKPIVLNIPIKGRPIPVCSWFFGGVKMKDKLDRIKIETTAKFTKLTVRESTLDDTGDYSLEVKNVTGTASEVIKVIILGENFKFDISLQVLQVYSYIKFSFFFFFKLTKYISFLDKPGVPVGPMKIDEVDATSVTCSWEPPEKDGGANVSGYVVEQRDAHRPGWMPVSESVTRPMFKFTRLVEGTEYVFRVAATNRFGIGGFLQSEVVECKSVKSTFFFYLFQVLSIYIYVI